ncbi:hypothetical protein Nepgr_022862 [Nepenthes gracilis]|uniref:Uncharacterized protein n=1 Tax=Nepenthes gracilis TaxID=150966 RepID=A0AAD3T094_NEPGR|nr:hypothetical protein Nepgr_022862 [Nepenthes gracilis]
MKSMLTGLSFPALHSIFVVFAGMESKPISFRPQTRFAARVKCQYGLCIGVFRFLLSVEVKSQLPIWFQEPCRSRIVIGVGPLRFNLRTGADLDTVWTYGRFEITVADLVSQWPVRFWVATLVKCQFAFTTAVA